MTAETLSGTGGTATESDLSVGMVQRINAIVLVLTSGVKAYGGGRLGFVMQLTGAIHMFGSANA